jgi:hypothetical protein
MYTPGYHHHIYLQWWYVCDPIHKEGLFPSSGDINRLMIGFARICILAEHVSRLINARNNSLAVIPLSFINLDNSAEHDMWMLVENCQPKRNYSSNVFNMYGYTSYIFNGWKINWLLDFARFSSFGVTFDRSTWNITMILNYF